MNYLVTSIDQTWSVRTWEEVLETVDPFCTYENWFYSELAGRPFIQFSRSGYNYYLVSANFA